MIKTQKFKIANPNKNLITLFEKNFGFRRWCWNQGLDIWKKQRKFYLEQEKLGNRKEKYPTAWFVRDELKKNLPEWADDYSLQILDTTCENIENGIKGAIEQSRKTKKPFFIKYKSKKSENGKTFSFYRKNELTFSLKKENGKYYFSGPRMTTKRNSRTKIWIQLSEKPKFNQENIKTATIYFRDSSFFITISYETEIKEELCKPKRIVGCDWGTKTFLTIAYGSENQRKYVKFNDVKNKLKRINQKISRIQSKRDKFCKKYSYRWKKLTKCAKKYYSLASHLKENQIKTTVAYLTKRFGTIVIEDLDISNMTKRAHKIVKQKSGLNRSCLDNSFYAFKTFLQQKCEELGRKLILADKTFPSTQTCSHCGHRLEKENKLKLKDRQFICPICGAIEDRDENAAYNLKLYAKNV